MASTDLKYRLRSLMTDKSVTVKDLAKRSGIHYVQIYRYLNGSPKGKEPSIANLVRLAHALNCTLEQLTGLPAVSGIEEATDKLDLTKLSDEERALLDAYGALPDDDWRKKMIDDILLKRGKEKEDDAGQS